MGSSVNLNPTFSTSVLCMNRRLQNGEQSSKDTNRLALSFGVDRVSISPQAKTASIIDVLTKQKMEIEDRKNDFISSALEKGQSMDSIQAQLDSYDEQIKEIDKQITEISADQMEKANEEEKENIKNSIKNNTPKTEEEIQNQRLQNLMEIVIGLDGVQAVDYVKTRIDGDSAVLESEIELDKMRSNGVSGPMKTIVKKEEQLADMQKQSVQLMEEIGDQIADLAEEIQENNKPVEKVEDTELEEDSKLTDDSEKSTMIENRIEQYRQMQHIEKGSEDSSEEERFFMDITA